MPSGKSPTTYMMDFEAEGGQQCLLPVAAHVVHAISEELQLDAQLEFRVPDQVHDCLRIILSRHSVVVNFDNAWNVFTLVKDYMQDANL